MPRVYATREIPGLAQLAELPQVELIVGSPDRSHAELVRAARGAEVIVCSLTDPIDRVLFEALAPFVADRNVHLAGEIKAPEAGGVLDLETPAGRAVISCFPFLREGRAFNVWEPAEEHYKKYADRLRRIAEAYSTQPGSLSSS